jgi:hypothetical protein
MCSAVLVSCCYNHTETSVWPVRFLWWCVWKLCSSVWNMGTGILVELCALQFILRVSWKYVSNWVNLLLKLNYLVRAYVAGTVGSFEVNCTQEVEVIACIWVQRKEERKIHDQILMYCVNICYEYVIAYLCDLHFVCVCVCVCVWFFF